MTNPKKDPESPYRFTMVDNKTAVVMDDQKEQVIFVMTRLQVEALLTWYAKETGRIII